jgi:hypothetical protein
MIRDAFRIEELQALTTVASRATSRRRSSCACADDASPWALDEVQWLPRRTDVRMRQPQLSLIRSGVVEKDARDVLAPAVKAAGDGGLPCA